jgi:RNA polymerase sigma-70 factor (ECF subfamily)
MPATADANTIGPAPMTSGVPGRAGATGANVGEAALLKLACDGDPDAFSELAQVYRAELHAHCYRMLGSVHDAEDALQEALLRAWQGLPGFEGRGQMRSWLYAIATNAALDSARHRSRRELPVDFSPSADQGTELDPPRAAPPWLEPYPDKWLASGPPLSPEACYEQHESVELAFMVALQHLPPMQRAVLLLREVVGLSTTEISAQLGKSAPSVNSALQRARATMRGRRPARSQQSELRALGEQRTQAIVERYAAAFEQADIDRLVSMLTEAAVWSMPPAPTRFCGREAISEFLVRGPLTERWRHRSTRANGQLAVGCYLFRPSQNEFVPAVLDVLALEGEKISAVTAFVAAETLQPPHSGGWVTGAELFARFGLPATPP